MLWRNPSAPRSKYRLVPVRGRPMQLVAPDILQEARGLPPMTLGACLAIGLFLWLFGARTHRFWIALAFTLAAGLVGLSYGPTYGMQPLVAGLLLAIGAGTLALSLVRVLLFVAGGFTALALVHALAPAFDEPIASFVVGGLAGVLLYRVWIMTLTSLTGTLLIAYAGICLLDRFRVAEAVAWSERHAAVLNWGCCAFAVLGLLLQYLLERGRSRRAKARAREEEERAEEWAHSLHQRQRPRPRGWLDWLHKKPARRAG
jgi:hypothetical protein